MMDDEIIGFFTMIGVVAFAVALLVFVLLLGDFVQNRIDHKSFEHKLDPPKNKEDAVEQVRIDTAYHEVLQKAHHACNMAFTKNDDESVQVIQELCELFDRQRKLS